MQLKNNNVSISDLGLIDFENAWIKQEEIFNSIVETKLFNRNNPEIVKQTSNYLLFCEHPHVYTLGKSGKPNNLLVNEQFLSQIKATYYKINRGGDITYHGPGQIVGYPILDLENFYSDIHRYMRDLEEVIIRTIDEFGLVGERIKGATGVWLTYNNSKLPRKICAMGVRASRWVTMHGFALNVNTDLSYFNHINPCGFTDKGVTSIQEELHQNIDSESVKNFIIKHFAEVFQVEIN